MAQCVAQTTVIGVKVLTPVTVTPCTTMVVLTPAEYEVMSVSPFRLTLEEGALISAAVLGVWGIGVCWRELAAFIKGGYTSEDLK